MGSISSIMGWLHVCGGLGGMSIGLVCANGMGPFARRRRGQECVASELGRPAPLRGEAKKVALSQGLRPVGSGRRYCSGVGS